MMKLFSWNVNGLRACWQKGFLAQILKQQAPEIICLQETKAQPEQVDFLNQFPDYQAVWASAQRPGYSGTLILTRLDFQRSQVGFPKAWRQRFQLADQFGQLDQEGRLVLVEFSDFQVLNVYTPNTKSDLSRLAIRHQGWDPAFLEYCRLLKQAKPLLVCGDFNVAHQEIDLARPQDNRGKNGFTDQERQGFSQLLTAGLTDIYRQQEPQKTGSYTWWTYRQQARQRNIGWRIDYWLASDDFLNRVGQAQIHSDIFGSDHCPISLTLKD